MTPRDLEGSVTQRIIDEAMGRGKIMTQAIQDGYESMITEISRREGVNPEESIKYFRDNYVVREEK